MIVTQEQLAEATGLTRGADIARHLKRAGIPFRVVNGRILTTEDAITAVLTGQKKNNRGPNFAAVAAPRPRQARGLLPRPAAGGESPVDVPQSGG